MKPLTFRVTEETADALADEADDADTSMAEYLRGIVEKRNRDEAIRDEYKARLAEYEAEVEDLEREIQRLKNEKRAILDQREENQELVAYVEDERRQQQAYREAGIVTRARWWLTGMDSDGD